MWCIGFGAKLRDHATFSLFSQQVTPPTKSTIKFGSVKGGLEFSRFTFSGSKWHLKIVTPYMVHHGAVRLSSINAKNSLKIFLQLKWSKHRLITLKTLNYRLKTQKTASKKKYFEKVINTSPNVKKYCERIRLIMWLPDSGSITIARSHEVWERAKRSPRLGERFRTSARAPGPLSRD